MCYFENDILIFFNISKYKTLSTLWHKVAVKSLKDNNYSTCFTKRVVCLKVDDTNIVFTENKGHSSGKL